MFLFLVMLGAASCGFLRDDAGISDGGSAGEPIVPDGGYEWPEAKREYWPTTGWRSAPLEAHGLDPDSMLSADSIAAGDDSFRSLLIVRNGYLVFERYYHGGGPDESTEVWSVTKSFVSALVGIAVDKGYIDSVDDPMVNYLPRYPDFEDISVKHVLTHTTGLNWNEQSMQSWIQSSDWIADALARGLNSRPGEALLYSSGNSHFLSGLILAATGMTPGKFADRCLFGPLGIEFEPLKEVRIYSDWSELHVPVPGSWRKGNDGLEIGAFGLHLTARDMAKFGFLFLNKGRWDGQSIVSEEWVEDSTRDHVQRSENFGFGYQWVVTRRGGHLAFDADGWGGQSISVIPDLDIVVVTKCDAVDPRNTSSYRVLELVVEAGSVQPDQSAGSVDLVRK